MTGSLFTKVPSSASKADRVTCVAVGPEEPLKGDVDVEAQARDIPPSFVVKGMFFTRLRDKLGDRWAAFEKSLEHPPRLGIFMPFNDYPQADYLRLCGAAAAAAYPNLPLREGLRRLARDDFRVFASSTFGKVVLASVGDVHRALLTVPTVYAKMASGDWQIRGEELGDKAVCVEFSPHYGSWEYKLGQFEGLVMHYRATSRTTISEQAAMALRFEITHGARI